MEFNRAMRHSIVVEPSENNGYCVRVGCVTLVYTDIEQMCSDIREFVMDPKGVEKQYTCRVRPVLESAGLEATAGVTVNAKAAARPLDEVDNWLTL